MKTPNYSNKTSGQSSNNSVTLCDNDSQVEIDMDKESLSKSSKNNNKTLEGTLLDTNKPIMNSEVRRKELDNIAEAALEFQPKGYTLETTQVI